GGWVGGVQRCALPIFRRRRPDAAMGGGAAEAMDFVPAVDGITAVEENRMRHRRIVVLLGEPGSFHSLRSVSAARRAIAGAAGRRSEEHTSELQSLTTP